MARSLCGSLPSIKLLLLVLPLLLHDVHVCGASGCLKKNGISVGWLPNEDDGGKMTDITSILGGSACYYGLFSQITTPDNYSGPQLTSHIDEVKASGAILQAAVMPTGLKFTDVNAKIAEQIAAVMKTFTDNGVQVWLRFAHEANFFVTDGTYPGGTAHEYVQAWRNVAKAVKGYSDVKMFWTPNNVGSKIEDLAAWWPGADYVDVVGIDIYPSTSQALSFAGVYGSFIDTYSKPYNKPFAVGETGATDASTKRAWLKQLSAASSLSRFPSYVGFSWFEYLKNGQDTRVVTGPVDYAKPILT